MSNRSSEVSILPGLLGETKFKKFNVKVIFHTVWQKLDIYGGYKEPPVCGVWSDNRLASDGLVVDRALAL